MSMKMEFASACRSAYVNRGIELVEQAVLNCAEQCKQSLGDEMKVEGVSVVAMPDQTVIVTVLASRTREEVPQPEDE